MAEREYYREDRRVYTALRHAGFRPATIYDVGASHAGWTLAIKQIFPEAEFHLFEPLIEFKSLYQEWVRNALAQWPDLHVYKVALADSDGEITLMSDEAGFSASALVTEVQPDLNQPIRVPARSMRSLVASDGLPVPDLLKMDVQGAEMMVLEGAGALLSQVQAVQAESWLDPYCGIHTPLFPTLKKYLETFGFILIEFGERNYFANHRLYALDCFFLKAELAKRFGKVLGPEPLI